VSLADSHRVDGRVAFSAPPRPRDCRDSFAHTFKYLGSRLCISKLSLATRLLGFVLALVGAFLVGYAQGVQSILGTIGGVVSVDTATMPTFTTMVQSIQSMVTTYLQGWESTNWNTYLVVGIAVAAGGLVLVAVGDRRRRNVRRVMPLQAQPLIIEQKERPS
jgi:hypothetical protein